jgi:hypothetical protein
MSGFEWFLLIGVVIVLPLVIAIAVTLWTLEQARLRNRRNHRSGSQPVAPGTADGGARNRQEVYEEPESPGNQPAASDPGGQSLRRD